MTVTEKFSIEHPAYQAYKEDVCNYHDAKLNGASDEEISMLLVSCERSHEKALDQLLVSPAIEFFSTDENPK